MTTQVMRTGGVSTFISAKLVQKARQSELHNFSLQMFCHYFHYCQGPTSDKCEKNVTNGSTETTNKHFIFYFETSITDWESMCRVG